MFCTLCNSHNLCYITKGTYDDLLDIKKSKKKCDSKGRFYNNPPSIRWGEPEVDITLDEVFEMADKYLPKESGGKNILKEVFNIVCTK